MIERLTWFAMGRPETTLGIVVHVTVAFAHQFPRTHIDTETLRRRR
ncbi:MAG: hypothetical protein ABIK65_07975 [Candidatus Eisenbacteria bacterium]